MSLDALGNFLEMAPEYKDLYKALVSERNSVRVQILSQATPFLLSTLQKKLRNPMLVISPTLEDSIRLHEQLLLWVGEHRRVLHFPETENLSFERIVSDVEITQQRLSTLGVLNHSKGHPPIVVASIGAVAQKTLDRSTFTRVSHKLRLGQRIDMEELVGIWQRMGYIFESTADVPGVASRRGGILDIFPIGAVFPVRIELFGDEIDSIRLFDPSTQRSTEFVDSMVIIPARETLPLLYDHNELNKLIHTLDMTNCNASTRDRISFEVDSMRDGLEVEEPDFYGGLFNLGSILDYFASDGLLVMYHPLNIEDVISARDARDNELRLVKERRGELPKGFPSSHTVWPELQRLIGAFSRRIDIVQWETDDLIRKDIHMLPFSISPTYSGNSAKLARDIEALRQEKHTVVVFTAVPKRLLEILDENGVKINLTDSMDNQITTGSITVKHATEKGMTEGCILSVNDEKLVILSDTEIFGTSKQRRRSVGRFRRRQNLISELKPGGYVVHVEHGIGRFVGVGSRDNDDDEREYLILEYASEDRLYVPMDHLDRVNPYIASMDRPPTLTRLGTQEWRRVKERVERSAKEMASELISLYAARELIDGYQYGPEVPWQLELEDSFQYEETVDQLTAMTEIKADMEQTKPMDRLICGDVGYGKTEIALRAAFKAVMDGKQVAVLVPTTVLAQQHYLTFTQRLSPYPINIQVLSRFCTDQEQRRIVSNLSNGRVDICIGTHRLIQRDVSFKDLGLIIIDEEQRFGVAQKEKLKQMRNEVDVLALTATPIPRTLHLSLAGIRDMSTIETPPEERLPIKTYVSKFSDDLVREAIQREIDRKGQVFFLHNRIYNIEYMANYIRRLVAEAEVAVAHGRMQEDELEKAMISFAEGDIDVLVCTTIIESGLDIPNVNTLIVNRADTFGLAQLYQLRGRVGRSSRRAYSYLLVPPTKSLSEIADKRLTTIVSANELGAGFQIAMKDLEIRGAGNILGAEQSGHIHAVGFDLYTQLLGEAVENLRASNEVDPIDLSNDVELQTSVDLGIPANIPEAYISDLPTRLNIYQRLSNVTSLEDTDILENELIDRFGPMPWQAKNLLYVRRLRLRALRARVKIITRELDFIMLWLDSDIGRSKDLIEGILGPNVCVGNTQLRFDPDVLNEGWEEKLTQMLEDLAEFWGKSTQD